MLAVELQNYVQKWQLLLLVPFLAGWLIGGTALVWWGLRKFAMVRHPDTGKCLLATFLAGAAAVLCGALVFVMVRSVGSALEREWMSEPAIAAAVTGVPISILVIYAVLDLSLKRTLQVWGLPIAGVVILAGVLAVIAFIPARRDFLAAQEIRSSKDRLDLIWRAIDLYEKQPGNLAGKPPPSLDALVDANTIFRRQLRDPRNGRMETGFFYLPLQSDQRDPNLSQLLACEYSFPITGGGFPGTDAGRVVLYARGDSLWIANADFERLLNLPENDLFARKFRDADRRYSQEGQ